MKHARFRILLVSLGALLMILPAGRLIGDTMALIIVVAYCLVFASATFAVSEGPRINLFSRVFAGVAIAMQIGSTISDVEIVGVASKILGVCFQGYLVVLILRYVYRVPHVTSETISAALSAYLITGFIWATAYTMIGHLEPQHTDSPGSFSFPTSSKGTPLKDFSHVNPAHHGALDEDQRFVYAVYFSFTTLTTLGYGDISPISPLACMLTTVEAIFGQFFLAVLLARLVGLQVAHSTHRESGQSG